MNGAEFYDVRRSATGLLAQFSPDVEVLVSLLHLHSPVRASFFLIVMLPFGRAYRRKT